ncbi:MAG: sps1E [Myxococcaceae bacterium]|nr:sps1E [Myxococcaceae bacterium]
MAHPDEDDGDAEDSPLWPRAADGSSGLRGAGLTAGPLASSSSARPSGASELGSSPYRLLGPMGSTAYGRVFRARHSAQQRDVALHFFTLDDDSEGTLARALPLAVAKVAQLSHPNVIALEDHGRDERNGTYYLVTEALEGVSLSDYLADVGSLPLSRALSFTLQIGRALRAAHKLGIVHGALTPANVRVLSSEANAAQAGVDPQARDPSDTTEPGELVRVVGFGCTTFSPRALSPGDPYQAPDQARDARDTQADARSDVFAVGALIYRMLTGRAPAPIKGGVAEPPSIAAFSEEPVPRELDELVARCMESDPDKRLSDLVSLMRELRVIARSVNMTSLIEERPSLRSPGSLPPELSASESDSSGSLFGAESSSRRGAMWVIAGLLLALAAVWLVWEASTRGRPDPDGPQRSWVPAARR